MMPPSVFISRIVESVRKNNMNKQRTLQSDLLIKPDQVQKADLKHIGGKAANVVKLYQNGFKIPKSYILTARAFKKFEKINIRKAILTIYDELKPPYAVRSSAVGEDGFTHSYAGIFDSYLNISKAPGDLFAAIMRCYRSLFSERAAAYRKQFGLSMTPMAVLIQEMIQPEKSGVIFTGTPEKKMFTLEWVPGLASAFVAGESAPNSCICNAQGEVSEERVSHSALEMTDEERHRLIRLAEDVRDVMGEEQDIEWALADGMYYLIQSRPKENEAQITITHHHLCSYSKEKVISGTIAKVPLKEPVKPGQILLMDHASPRYLADLENCTAVICDQGGILNHFAILCRELGIPYFAAKNSYRRLQNGDQVRLDLGDTSTPLQYKLQEGWQEMMRFIPELTDQQLWDSYSQSLQQIPVLLNLPFDFQFRVQEKGIYAQKESIESLVQQVLENLSETYTNIVKIDPKKDALPMTILSGILIQPLFLELVSHVGSINRALLLLRGLDPLYLFPKGEYVCNGEKFLTRFGIGEGEKLSVPHSLIRQKENLDGKRNAETEKILAASKDSNRVEFLTKMICLLEERYEGKNRS